MSEKTTVISVRGNRPHECENQEGDVLIFLDDLDMMVRAERGVSDPARLDSPRRTLNEARHAMTASHPIVSGVRFKDVPDFPGYSVGDDGSSWSCLVHSGFGTWTLGSQWRRKATFVGKRGYASVTFYSEGTGKSFDVHRLVAGAFFGPCPVGMEVRHRNGDRTDNRLTNLEYGTPLQNAADRERHGNTCTGERNGSARLTSRDVNEIRRKLSAGQTQKSVADEYGIHKSTVSLIARGKKWAHLC